MKELNEIELKAIEGGSIWGAIVAGILLAGVAWGIANFVHDVIIERQPFDMTTW